MSIELIPFDLEHIEPSWGWLLEYPKHNFDDFGPKCIEDWTKLCACRVQDEGELTFTVTLDGEAVGIIGVTWPGGRLAVMHGICFARRVHGKGIAAEAMRRLISQLFASGVERIEAYSLAGNLRVHRFLTKLGFHQEGILRQRTVQNGKRIDVRLSAALAPTRVAVEQPSMQEVLQ